MHRIGEHDLKSVLQESSPKRIQHRERAADHKARQIIQPVPICVFRVNRLLASALKTFLLDTADDGCGPGDVPAMCQIYNAFPLVESNQEASGQNLRAQAFGATRRNFPLAWRVPWLKLEADNLAHTIGVAASGGMY